MEILHLKLKKDLLKLALDYNKDKSEEEFTEWVTQRIDSYISEKKISFSFTNETRVNPIKCSARVWNEGKGQK